MVALGATALAADHDARSTAERPACPTWPCRSSIPALEGRLRESLTLLGVAARHADRRRRRRRRPGRADLPSSRRVEWLAIAGLSAGLRPLDPAPVHRRRPGEPQPYAEATRLLTQLRTRRPPAARAPPSTRAASPSTCSRSCARSRRSTGPRCCRPAAAGGWSCSPSTGVDRVDWETSLDADSAIADAWASQQPQIANRSQARIAPAGGDASSLVVPLVAGVRTVGAGRARGRRAGAYPSARGRPDRRADHARPRCGWRRRCSSTTSGRWPPTRSASGWPGRSTTASPRSWSWSATASTTRWPRCPRAPTRPPRSCAALRAEVTRVITELRLSLFELRSEVDRHGGLAAAIAEYARTVGAAGGLRVHFSVEESTARLPAAIEAELLRIAQEAITNARKHAGASESLGDLRSRPAVRARSRYPTTAQGLADHRPEGRFGLAIMAERAERIRGQLEITPRHRRRDNRGGGARHPAAARVACVIAFRTRRGVTTSMTTSTRRRRDPHQGAARRRSRPDPQGPAARLRARPATSRSSARPAPPPRRSARPAPCSPTS